MHVSWYEYWKKIKIMKIMLQTEIGLNGPKFKPNFFLPHSVSAKGPKQKIPAFLAETKWNWQLWLID